LLGSVEQAGGLGQDVHDPRLRPRCSLIVASTTPGSSGVARWRLARSMAASSSASEGYSSAVRSLVGMGSRGSFVSGPRHGLTSRAEAALACGAGQARTEAGEASRCGPKPSAWLISAQGVRPTGSEPYREATKASNYRPAGRFR